MAKWYVYLCIILAFQGEERLAGIANLTVWKKFLYYVEFFQFILTADFLFLYTQ